MQQEENYLAQSISQVDADARYDEGVKRLLANKSILAVIMKECVPEYRGCTVWEIAEKYIEGEPQIGAVGVDAEARQCLVDERECAAVERFVCHKVIAAAEQRQQRGGDGTHAGRERRAVLPPSSSAIFCSSWLVVGLPRRE